MKRWRRLRVPAFQPSRCGSSAHVTGCANGGSESGMIDPELDPDIEWIAREAKRAVAVDPMAVERVMARVRLEPRARVHNLRWRWIVEPRSLPLSPFVGAALTSAIVGTGILLVHFQISRYDQHLTASRPPSVLA